MRKVTQENVLKMSTLPLVQTVPLIFVASVQEAEQKSSCHFQEMFDWTCATFLGNVGGIINRKNKQTRRIVLKKKQRQIYDCLKKIWTDEGKFKNLYKRGVKLPGSKIYYSVKRNSGCVGRFKEKDEIRFSGTSLNCSMNWTVKHPTRLRVVNHKTQ